MIQRDTLYITDSVSCRYIVIDKYPSDKDTVLPLNSLWSSGTLVTPSSYHSGTVATTSSFEKNIKTGNDIISVLFLAFFVLLVFFSREIIEVIPALMKALFKLKNHARLENKLSLSKQRDVVTIVAALYFPVLIALISGDYIIEQYHVTPLISLIASMACIALLWFVRKAVLALISWVANDKSTFKMIEKIGYNHLIISVVFSFPAIILNFIYPDLPVELIFKVLAAGCLFVFLFYLIRGYQIIISHKYSHFFYILYLCAVELLPIALIVNFILSY